MASLRTTSFISGSRMLYFFIPVNQVSIIRRENNKINCIYTKLQRSLLRSQFLSGYVQFLATKSSRSLRYVSNSSCGLSTKPETGVTEIIGLSETAAVSLDILPETWRLFNNYTSRSTVHFVVCVILTMWFEHGQFLHTYKGLTSRITYVFLNVCAWAYRYVSVWRFTMFYVDICSIYM